jgi:hypothetical protein
MRLTNLSWAILIVLGVIVAFLLTAWLTAITKGIFLMVLLVGGFLVMLVCTVKSGLEEMEFYRKVKRDRELRENGIDI